MNVALRAWLVFLGPPVVWAVHLLVAYSAEEIICSSDVGGDVAGFTLLELVIAAATVGAVAACLIAGVQGYRLWHERARASAGEPPHGREAFLGLGGALFGGLFAVAVLLEASPALVLQPCMSMLPVW